MPIRRGADGNIIEEKTERADSFEHAAGPEECGTVPMRPEAGRQPGPDEDSRADTPQQSGYEARTVVARSKTAPVEEAALADSAPGDHTRIYRSGARKDRGAAHPPEQPGSPDEAAPVPDTMDDPPVGWLVVIQGAGQGKVVTIGNGSNAIGRDPGERICLDFGDETISRHGHATITYDPRGRKFYIQHGGGKNLTYVEESPVLLPTELAAFSKMQIGETVLLFVPLCGERFDWAEYAE